MKPVLIVLLLFVSCASTYFERSKYNPSSLVSIGRLASGDNPEAGDIAILKGRNIENYSKYEGQITKAHKGKVSKDMSALLSSLDSNVYLVLGAEVFMVPPSCYQINYSRAIGHRKISKNNEERLVSKEEEKRNLASQEENRKIASQEENRKIASQEENRKIANQEENRKLTTQEEDRKLKNTKEADSCVLDRVNYGIKLKFNYDQIIYIHGNERKVFKGNFIPYVQSFYMKTDVVN